MCRAWKLFLFLPRMLLFRPPRGGLIPKCVSCTRSLFCCLPVRRHLRTRDGFNNAAARRQAIPERRAEPAALGPPGLHTTTRELHTCTFERPGASNTTKIPREDPLERERIKNEISGGREKKKERNLGPPFGPYRSGPNPFGPPHHPTHRPTTPPKTKIGQMRPVKFGQMWYWPNSVWPNAAK